MNLIIYCNPPKHGCGYDTIYAAPPQKMYVYLFISTYKKKNTYKCTHTCKYAHGPSSTSQHYAGMTLSTSPTNEHNTSLRKDNTKELSNIKLQQTPAGKNMVVSLTSSYAANNSQVQSFVAIVEIFQAK